MLWNQVHISTTSMLKTVDSRYQELLVDTNVCNPRSAADLPFVPLTTACLVLQYRLMCVHLFYAQIIELHWWQSLGLSFSLTHSTLRSLYVCLIRSPNTLISVLVLFRYSIWFHPCCSNLPSCLNKYLLLPLSIITFIYFFSYITKWYENVVQK